MKDDVTALSSRLRGTKMLGVVATEVAPVLPQVSGLVNGYPKRTTVLCVDNLAARLNAVKALLEDLGCDVWTAKDLVDGLALLEGLEFTAMVVDPHGVCLDEEDVHLITANWPRLSVITPQEVLLQLGDRAAEEIQPRASEFPADASLSDCEFLSLG